MNPDSKKTDSKNQDSKNPFRPTYKEWFLVVALIALPLLVGFVIAFDEPFSLFEGISMWPAEFLKITALWLSLLLSFRALDEMKENEEKIEEEFKLLVSNDDIKGDIGSIWFGYKEHEEFKRRKERTFWMAVSWFGICALLYFIQGPNIPFRGSGIFLFDWFFTIATFAGFVVLFAIVYDAAMHCRNLIKDLADVDTVGWPKMPDSRPLVQDIMREWFEIKMIGMRSDVISRTIYYPVYVILVLLAAYNDYFDNFDMPLSLMVIGILNIALVLILAIMLRKEAMEAREESLKKLGNVEANLLRRRGAERETGLAKLRLYEKRIMGIREGAFLPVSEQPWLRALTLMTGGGSSLLFLQYLSG